MAKDRWGRSPRRSRTVAAVMAAVAVVAAVALIAIPDAEARSSYCSPSGDYCYGLQKAGRLTVLRIDSFVDLGRVKVCLTSRNKPRACTRFGLRRERGGVYTRRLRVHFKSWRGRYQAAWRTLSGPLGSRLTLRR